MRRFWAGFREFFEMDLWHLGAFTALVTCVLGGVAIMLVLTYIITLISGAMYCG